jgi:hypothetical protein
MAAQDRQTQPLKALAAHQRPSTSWEQATPRDPRLSTPVIKRLSDRRLRITVHVHPSARGTWQVRATRAGRTYIKRVQRTRWTTAVTVARARHPEADRRVRRAPRLEGRPLPPPPAARAVAPRSTGRRTTCARHTARDLLHGRGRFCFACQGAGQGDGNGTTAFACQRKPRMFGRVGAPFPIATGLAGSGVWARIGPRETGLPQLAPALAAQRVTRWFAR